MMKKMMLIISFLLILLLNGCATDTKSASETYKGESPQHIYEEGRKALRDEHYSEAVKRFEALEVQYPYFAAADNVSLNLIYAYYMKEDYALSVAAAERFIRLNPNHRNVDYAYYMRGLADFFQNMGVLEHYFTVDLAKRDLKQIRKSFNDFNALVMRFPNSRYTPAAHQYLVYLRNLMARHELQVAEFYYKKKAYIAAANRASGLVAHYQGSPDVVNALKIMARSYHELGMTRQEHDVLQVMQYNHMTLNDG